MSPSVLLLIAVSIAVSLLVLAGARDALRGQGQRMGIHPYVAVDGLLSKGELAFHRSLQGVVPDHVCIQSKVRLADIINVTSGLDKKSRSAAFNKIQSKHIDFVLCDNTSMKILCAIELHDKSHNSTDRRERDDFVRQAFVSAKVPYLELRARASYSQSELREQVICMLTGGATKAAYFEGHLHTL